MAYLSKGLGNKGSDLYTYEKDFLAILLAIEKWRHYFEGGSLLIRTDHKSLKHLSDQKLSHPLQYKVLTKLLGLDYKIQSKKG
jgi:hypothetical protein